MFFRFTEVGFTSQMWEGGSLQRPVSIIHSFSRSGSPVKRMVLISAGSGGSGVVVLRNVDIVLSRLRFAAQIEQPKDIVLGQTQLWRIAVVL